MGWDDGQRKERLRFIAQNARFLTLPGYNVANMAARVLAKNLKRLSDDRQSLYGHPIVMVEAFAGTLYRASGWTHVGDTSGFGRKNGAYVERGQPKQAYVRPLLRRAPDVLSAPYLSPEPTPSSKAKLDINQLSVTSLLSRLSTVPDPRKRRGVGHSFVSVLAIWTMAVLQGAKSILAIADFAEGLTPALLKQFGAFRSPSTGAWIAPSEPTIRRTLSQVDGDALDDALGAYPNTLTPLAAIAIDGKTLRGSRTQKAKARHLMAAVRHDLRVVLAQREVGEKSNEIPLAPKRLDTIDDLSQTVVTADAMHTQTSFACYVVEERGSNYVLTVQDNLPTLHRELAALKWGLSPLFTTREKSHGRIETRTIQAIATPGGLGTSSGFPYIEQAMRIHRKTTSTTTGKTSEETVYAITSLQVEEAAEARLLALVRGHWSVEALHWIRDVTFDADRSRVRTTNGPRVMASLRNLAISLHALMGHRTVAQAAAGCARAHAKR